ncbi:3'(2'),5'-bisphosphate nucleotidase [Enterovibrio norvegicus FF-33]|uniref:3'(2'),5'-bisphosphate nucleotidase CysQ n=1 Tax=Enterovibrio norvegicus FF-454 TaxID=1185651 RepID=A0A1E5CD92_9GAMM|nr:3'(2'),5'-bisphosphate nucleotidase CysQ [Enterovibrio norvegicus]OEE63486.1 3'(2'),5'-bisphosphate nucleotidase [Enterovibrio norvegicus FF-454]OEE71142.1 3'(2'),5'-bisphosphate nucleotidase [Enterovibrio norvegicus FF-33]OEE74655.1 3'(2'),5'-bisphosphate nucleotidase [Enterovibrio norvegicus FF-162]
MELSQLLQPVIEIARESGQVILDIYQRGDFEQNIKSDDTPVTSADLAAHKLVTERLKALTPDIPVLSEEDTAVPLKERENWTRYWLVDPLDGTQEFIAGSGDFATIIALVEDNQPVMGVVYGPVSGVSYYAAKGHGAWKVMPDGEKVRLSIMKHDGGVTSLSIAISRRQDIKAITERLAPSLNYNLVPLGSAALKSCLVAEGAVDCYLRLGPTGEWDTAATQCIVEESGGRILDTTLSPLSYNERESLENPNFIVLGDTELPWRDIVRLED